MLFRLTLEDNPGGAGFGFKEILVWIEYLEADESNKASQKELFEVSALFAAAGSRERQNSSPKGT